MLPHRHEPGALKQHNKAFKSRFATKSEQRKKSKGRVATDQPASAAPRSAVKSQGSFGSKAIRKNQQKQKLVAQRAALVAASRSSISGAPKCVAVLPLSDNVNLPAVVMAATGSQTVDCTKPVTCQSVL